MDSKQTQHLKIGVLGFGAMGRTHTWAIHNLPFFYGSLPFTATAVGVCTTTQEKSDRVAKEFGFLKATANEDDLIYDPEINVIDICTPNVYHFETLKKAVATGKHVLCEKPLCISPAQATEILAIPRRRGQILGMDPVSGGQQVSSLVPLAEMFGYATALRSKTQGRGVYAMEPAGFMEVPKSIQEAIITQRGKK